MTTPSIWKTIKLGTTSPEELEIALNASGINISARAQFMLRSLETTPSQEREADLVLVSVSEVNSEGIGAIRSAIDSWAIAELGLELCPPEVGPYLRLQHEDRGKFEGLNIAMKPISDSLGIPNVFAIGNHGNGPILYSDKGSPKAFWGNISRWVYCLPR